MRSLLLVKYSLISLNALDTSDPFIYIILFDLYNNPILHQYYRPILHQKS